MSEAIDDVIDLLLVEDEAHMVAGLQTIFAAEGFQVRVASDGDAALAAVDPVPQLAVVDVMLPKRDGFAVVRHWRQHGLHFPVLMLTARAAEADTVTGLESGADDYLTKPFRIAELLARVRALLRRSQDFSTAQDPDRIGPMRCDWNARVLRGPGGESSLSRQECEMLRVLLQRQGKNASRDELLAEVWGDDSAVTARVVDYHIVRLRRKIAAASGIDEPHFLHTDYGRGYRLSV